MKLVPKVFRIAREEDLVTRIISEIDNTYGYCHIGGLYLLKDSKFYQSSDFYDEDTGNPICRNLGFDDAFSFDIKNHGYLNVGKKVIEKYQEDKKFKIFKFFK